MRIPIHRLLFKPTLGHRGHGFPRGVYGYCDPQKRVIELDPRGPHLARTLLHELLHLAHPAWSEKHVRQEEATRWRRLTWKEKARLYQAIGRGRIE